MTALTPEERRRFTKNVSLGFAYGTGDIQDALNQQNESIGIEEVRDYVAKLSELIQEDKERA